MNEKVRISTKSQETKRENFLSQKQNSDFSQTEHVPFDQTLLLQRNLGNEALQRMMESGAVQAKLKIDRVSRLTLNHPNDKYEQEADRVADLVMRMPEPGQSLVNGHWSLVQRESTCPECMEEEEEEKEIQAKRITNQTEKLGQKMEQLQTKLVRENGSGDNVAPPIVHEVLRSPGQPLDPTTRDFMESRFGNDFRHVRVHADPQASASARAVQALAYTVGHNIVFGSGQFAPQAKSGKQLLAHELVHVIHQTGGASKTVPDTSPVKARGPAPTPQAQVQHRSTSLRLSRQNTQQTASVLSRGAVASVQLIVNGTMNSTRVGPVMQLEDVSVIIGRLTKIRELAQVLLPLWNTATPFTPPGSTTPVAFTPLTVDELAKGLLVFNRYRLAIPPAATPPVMTQWKIGMRFPLPIRVDTATNEGVLHPDPIRAMAGTFNAAWSPLLDTLPEVLPALPTANLQQSVTAFLTNNPTTSARGTHLGARAVANAQDSKEFILAVFNQVGAGAFDLALSFMDSLVNRDIAVLAPQTAGADILNRIRGLLAAPPRTLSATQQASLNRANRMLGLVAGVQPMPDPCIPNRQLTWNNFTGAIPASAPASRGAYTRFRIVQVPYQGGQLFQARLNQGASWVRPKYVQPNNPAVNGYAPDIQQCQQHFNNLPPGTSGANWNFQPGPAAGCPASILPRHTVVAHSHGDCTTRIEPECTRAARLESQRLLRHEQLHFDIPCVIAHIANKYQAMGTAVTLRNVQSRASTLTSQYDRQTSNGCNAASQATWEANVAAGLQGQSFP